MPAEWIGWRSASAVPAWSTRPDRTPADAVILSGLALLIDAGDPSPWCRWRARPRSSRIEQASRRGKRRGDPRQGAARAHGAVADIAQARHAWRVSPCRSDIRLPRGVHFGPAMIGSKPSGGIIVPSVQLQELAVQDQAVK